jgi:uncharacterized membrane protein
MKHLGDLRFVIGLFFSIVGAILLLASAFGPSDLVPGAGVKGNLVTGVPITLFGLVMLAFALRTPASDHDHSE